MKILNPSVTELFNTDPLTHIESIGRICYKSTMSETRDGTVKFIRNLIDNKHHAMLEHAIFHFTLPSTAKGYVLNTLLPDKYMEVDYLGKYQVYLVTASPRAICQRDVYDPLSRALNSEYPELYWGSIVPKYESLEAKLINNPSEFELSEQVLDKHTFRTLLFTTDRGVSHELVRHRMFSFAQESTRYCNYTKDKYGNELTFIYPTNFSNWNAEQQDMFFMNARNTESLYMGAVLQVGLTPEQARAILPHSVKTDIVVTGNMKNWRHFIDLRSKGTTGTPHPDMKAVADIALEILTK